MKPPKDHYVYVYRTNSGREIVYVGYGRKSQRATVHRGSSHNPELKSWLNKNTFQISVAGPFSNQKTAKEVEAALISAIQPRFNKVGGDGPKFLPVGVPPDLWRRPIQPPLTLSEVGKKSGGALLVYLSPGDRLKDGRKKFDAVHPSDEDAVSNIERAWEIGSLIKVWEKKPALLPKVVIGVHGRVSHRFIVGSLQIEPEKLGDINFKEVGGRPGRWEIPLRDRSNLDYKNLRGRMLKNVRFGQFSNQLHIWVDGNGRIRHPKSSR